MRKKNKSSIRKAATISMLAIALLIEKCLRKIEFRQRELNSGETYTNHKLNLLSILYHTLGILYNE